MRRPRRNSTRRFRNDRSNFSSRETPFESLLLDWLKKKEKMDFRETNYFASIRKVLFVGSYEATTSLNFIS